MKSRVIVTRFAPKGMVLNLFGFYLTRDDSWVDFRIINHERIHDAQQRELLYILFYILYLLEYLVRLIQYRNHRKAYLNISFEREAYANDHDLRYLSRRRHFNSCRYLHYSSK